jgi:hypothetical protein
LKSTIIASVDFGSGQWQDQTLFQNTSVSTFIVPLHIDENGALRNRADLHLNTSKAALNHTFLVEFNFQRPPAPAATDAAVLNIPPYVCSLPLLCVDRKPLFLIRIADQSRALLSFYRLKKMIRAVWPSYADPIFLSWSDQIIADGLIENSITSIPCLEKDGRLDYDSYRYYSHFPPFPTASYYIPSCHALEGASSHLYHNYSSDSYLDWMQVSLAWSYLFHYPSGFSAIYVGDLKAHSQISTHRHLNFDKPKLVLEPSAVPMPDLLRGLSHASNTAIVIHAFYPESLPEILELAEQSKDVIDYHITTTREKIEAVAACLQDHDIPTYRIYVVPNHGRDIAPFMRTILPVLVEEGYDHFIKIHTKKSFHRDDGADWGAHLVSSLVSKDSIDHIRRTLKTDGRVGLLAPPGSIIPLTTCLNLNVLWLAELLVAFNISPKWALQRSFLAGSMFAGRVDVFRSLINKMPALESYEPEAGQVDATLAHAIERFLAIFVAHQGFTLDALPGDATLAPAFGYQESRPIPGSAKTLEQKTSDL